MASINKKRCRGHTYYQIVESKRINGKPRPIVLWHLGTADSLLRKLRSEDLKKKIHSWSHGSVSALWHIAEQMDIINLFKTEFSQNRRDGAYVGISLLLAAIHRAVKPDSKRAFADWARQTTLPRIAGFDPVKLDSQHFWDQMDTVTQRQLENVEKQITIILKNKGLLSPSLLFYDTTNFFTFIDSNNSKTKLAKRGKNKQKRNDLRQFGLAQVVTREFLIPIYSKIYQGNKSDSKLFVPNITELRRKLEELEVQIEDMTIVFDKGNNSKANFVQLDKMELPYVASLSAAHHEDLINIPKWRYYTVAVGEKKIRFYRTKKMIWGKEWSDSEIISAYYGLSHVERFFRHIKNPYHHAVRPQYHWTDQKIMVHTFICLTGFLLSQLLQKKITEAGHKISTDVLLDRLSKVREAETIELTGLKGRPKRTIQLEEMDDDLRKLFDDAMK